MRMSQSLTVFYNLHRQGKSGHDIAAELSLARGTVRKYIQTEGPVRIAPKKRKPSLLDSYYEYLCQRWNEETPTAQQLFNEIQDKALRELPRSQSYSSPSSLISSYGACTEARAFGRMDERSP
jgi:transposase